MTVDLLGWIEAPDASHGVRFCDDVEGWTRTVAYPELADRVRRVAAQLAAANPRHGAPVALVLPNGEEFITAFFGVLYAGLVPTPIAPPAPFEEGYVERLTGLLRTADPCLVVTTEELLGAVEPAVAGADAPPPMVLDPAPDGPMLDAPGPPAELALLQFTSGSSGAPRGAMVTRANLEANLTMIRRWLRWDKDQAMASWLPLFHDMGLIGGMVCPLVFQTSVRILRPDQFLRWPERWLDCFGRHGATLTTAPTFAYAYTQRRLHEHDLSGYDLSRWRSAVVGAERVDAAVLARFAEWLGPHGFSDSTFVPAYGMAEATLAVAGKAPGAEPRAVRVDWGAMAAGHADAVSATTGIRQRERIGDGADWVVSCGPPLYGLALEVVAGDGSAAPDGSVGEIVLQGPTVAKGYRALKDYGATRFDDGRLHTGDAGFLLDGELFVIGRISDSFKLRGAAVYAEDLEASLVQAQRLGGRPRVVVCGTTPRGPGVAVVVERDAGGWADEVADLLHNRLGREVPVTVYAGPRGCIERTSSGKPRRRSIWRRLSEADHQFVVAATRPAETTGGTR